MFAVGKIRRAIAPAPLSRLSPRFLVVSPFATSIEPKENWRFRRINSCLFCEPGKVNSLAVCFEHNYFTCHRCGTKGSTGDYEAQLLKLDANSPPRRDYEVAKRAFLQYAGSSSSASSARFFSTGSPAFHSIIPPRQQIAPPLQISEEEREKLELPAKALEREWTQEQDLSTNNRVIGFLKRRGLKRETCLFYNVGTQKMLFRDPNGAVDAQEKPRMVSTDVVTFPYIFRPGEFDPLQKRDVPLLRTAELQVFRYKARGVEDKRQMRSVPSGSYSQSFFGWHTIPANAKEIVITEGEIDAMTVFQETKVPAVSVPNGANAFPDSLVHALARFDKVILWFDDDAAGKDGCEKAAAKISQKYGPSKCLVVRPNERELAAAKPPHSKERSLDAVPPKDANDFFLRGYDLSKLLAFRKPMKHQMLVSAAELFPDLHTLYKNPDANKGRQFVGFPSLNQLLGGHRLGELTIFSGPTGSGKTTLLSQLSLDLCMNGIPTLWGSFEISILRLQQIMFNQFVYHQLHSGWRSEIQEERDGDGSIPQFPLSFLKEQDIFQLYSEEFITRCPMNFMSFFGSTDISDVVSVMRHAVEVQDVRHIIIDNLQYMVSGSGLGPNWKPTNSAYNALNKFETMERALDHFRAFATNYKVHVSIVVHPRKVAEGLPLTLDSIMGTAKATQEADNVMVIQKLDNGGKVLELKKNRYDGNLGKMALRFRPEVKCFFDEGLMRSVNHQETTNASSSSVSGVSYSDAGVPGPSTAPGESGSLSKLRFPKFSPNEDQALLEGTKACVDGSEINIFEQVKEEFLPHRDVTVLQARFRELKKLKQGK